VQQPETGIFDWQVSEQVEKSRERVARKDGQTALKQSSAAVDVPRLIEQDDFTQVGQKEGVDEDAMQQKEPERDGSE
jgi:hypothetical protein